MRKALGAKREYNYNSHNEQVTSFGWIVAVAFLPVHFIGWVVGRAWYAVRRGFQMGKR